MDALKQHYPTLSAVILIAANTSSHRASFDGAEFTSFYLTKSARPV